MDKELHISHSRLPGFRVARAREELRGPAPIVVGHCSLLMFNTMMHMPTARVEQVHQLAFALCRVSSWLWYKEH